MELMYARRSDSDQWLGRLTPSVEDKLDKESLKVRSLHVSISAGSSFEVRGETVEIVDIDRWDCSCKGWQLTGLPCCHAIAVIGCIGRSPYEFCSRYFTVESYRLTYSETLHPLPIINRPFQDDSQGAVTVTPPPTRRPPGRPTKKRFGSQEVVKRQLQCSRCRGMGHNKSTCKEFLLEQ
uniref:SWIM-type domain-containing protein n=3 Tax=Opuntia streptacantha TaxID=393608 RepID=A0A7C9E023_OPUST